MTVATLFDSPEKGVRLRCDSLYLPINSTIGNNEKSARRQVSLASSQALRSMTDSGGLCAARFYANIETDGLNYRLLHPGNRLLIGDCILRITQVGKRCFPGCTIPDQAACPIRMDCAFAAVVSGGTIRTGQTLTLEQEQP